MKFFSSIFVFIFSVLFCFGQAPTNGLKAYWPMDANAMDESGNNNHGTPTSLVATDDRFGNPNGAYLFNGTTSLITTNYAGILGMKQKTVSFWAKTSRTTGMFPLTWGGPYATAGARFDCILNYNGNTVTGGSAMCYVGYSASVSDNIWHHYVYVVEDTISPTSYDIKMYQDGILISNQNPATTYNPNTIINVQNSLNLRIGSDPIGNNVFQGSMDEVRIYDRALSSTEIGLLFNEPSISSGAIGYIYNDINQNCIQNTFEPGVNARTLRIQPGNHVVQTNSNGMWEIDSLAIGNYTITIDTTGGFWSTSCPGTQYFTIVNPSAITHAPDFGVISTHPCIAPEISIYAPRLRRCFSNQTLFVTAGNLITASGAINNAYADVKLDSFLIFQSASIADSAMGGNVRRFQLGNLNPGQNINFSIQTQVSCSTVNNQTLCMEAILYPIDSCVFDTIVAIANPDNQGAVSPCNLPWDKSSLKVNGKCTGDSIIFTVKNTGAAGDGDMDCFAPVRIYIDGVLFDIDSIKLLGGQTQTFAFLGTGQTWILQADQHPLHPGNSQPNAHVELCGSSSQWTPNLINNFPQDDADPVNDIYCGIVTGSYDPNDKTGFPLGIGNEHDIHPNIKLQYVIRFQNTGNDTAFTVVIRDTLDTDLNLNSIKSGAASHNYTFRNYGPRVLEWTFNNILLPDSTTNQVGSNGFISFEVDQNLNLAEGVKIKNSADIYFDFNAPVITNQTQHTINRFTQKPLGLKKINFTCSVSPNPTKGLLTVSTGSLGTSEKFNLKLVNLSGQTVMEKLDLLGNSAQLNITELPPGLYFLKIEKNQRSSTLKVVKE